MSLFYEKNGGLEYKNGGETVCIIPWGKNSFRVLSRPLGDINYDCSALIEQNDCNVEIKLQGETAQITNGNITAFLDNSGWNSTVVITYMNSKGETLLREIDQGGALCKKPRHFKPIIGGDYKLKVSFVSNPNEKIYGMGQYQQEQMDLKGCCLELAHRNSQASIPFYVSSLGYGFFWHNPAIGSVCFGKNVTEWAAESTKQMDYWITADDTPALIQERYAEVTGKAPMMPEFGLGFWQCKLRYHTQEEVLRVAREYKKRNIPIDVLVIDYYHWPRCGDYRFDEEFFPNPKEMVDELKEMGIELMVSVWPQIDWRSENFNEMYQKGLLVQTDHGLNVQMTFHGNNVFYDATNPEARKYVWEKCKKYYADLGIKLFWLDEAEPEFSTYDYFNYRYHEGSVLQAGNVYPREYSRGFYEGQIQNGQNDIVNLVRCAWAGSQKYGALVWSGDISSTYEDFRKQICAGLHMGISGIPWWTTDIGGFHGGNIYDDNFKELLIRWFQFGTFCPVMRIHGNREPFTPIINSAGEEREKTGADNEVWSYGEEAYSIMLKFIKVRELMRDYTRSLMIEAHEKGTPVMRTLFYEFPEDKICWDISTQFMFGADILVAPIVYPNAQSREVYLPAGASWINASTGKCFEGGKTHIIGASIETLPVFLRDGKQAYLIGAI